MNVSPTFRERHVGDMAENVREANELITKALWTMISDPLRAWARRSSRNGRPQRSLPPRPLITNDVFSPAMPSRPEPRLSVVEHS